MTAGSILIVDDFELYLLKLKKDLEPFLPVYVAASTAEALRLLDEHSSEIMAVVVDASMRGMNSTEFLDFIAMRFPEVRRILCSIGPAPRGAEAHQFVSKFPPENLPGRLMFEVRRPVNRV